MPASVTATHAPRRRRRASALAEFLTIETVGGIVLLVGVIAAVAWANLASASYVSFWSRDLTLGVGGVEITETFGDWVTEGLMTIFFFVVGLEIKRELVVGELRDPRRAVLPAL